MSTQTSTIVQRLWNYCNVLRDDGVSYGDYLEQLTYLLFLKMDDENQLIGKPSVIAPELVRICSSKLLRPQLQPDQRQQHGDEDHQA